MANRFASPVRKPAFAPEPMSPRKPVTRSKDCNDEFAEFQTPVSKLARAPCFSECSTSCPSGSTSFDLDCGNLEANTTELEYLRDLPGKSSVSFHDLHLFFQPASSVPWQLPGGVPLDSRPGTPPAGISAPGPLDTPPPAPKNRAAAKPDLLRALTLQDLQAVKEALAEDPDAANEPFWDQQCEPPLCCAVRLSCSAAIIAELLHHGADVNASDVRGCSPHMLLQRARQTLGLPALHEWDAIEALLCEAGAQQGEGDVYAQEDSWGTPLLFDAPPHAFLPPLMPWNSDALPLAARGALLPSALGT